MIIVEKNEGVKIPFEEIGTKVCFDDDLTINLAKRQGDWDVHIDVCYDEDGTLVIGAAAGRSYVAEIDIPPKEYETPKETETESESEAPKALPLDMNKVKLTLWAIEQEA